MTPGDTARLLAACALYDFRTVEKPDVAAWFHVIGDLDYDDAMEAVRRHYMESTDRMMPAHVRRGVKAIKAERRRKNPHEARQLPSRFEPDTDRRRRLNGGAATAKEVLGPLLARIAEQSPAPASYEALNQLREITAGPAWDDASADGEEGK